MNFYQFATNPSISGPKPMLQFGLKSNGAWYHIFDLVQRLNPENELAVFGFLIQELTEVEGDLLSGSYMNFELLFLNGSILYPEIVISDNSRMVRSGPKHRKHENDSFLILVKEIGNSELDIIQNTVNEIIGEISLATTRFTFRKQLFSLQTKRNLNSEKPFTYKFSWQFIDSASKFVVSKYESVVSDIQKLNSKIEELESKKKSKIRLAISLNNNLSKENNQTAFLKQWFAIEVLLQTEGDKTIMKIKNKLKEIHSIDTSKSETIPIGLLFGLRSEIVHNGLTINIPTPILILVWELFVDLCMHEIDSKSTRENSIEVMTEYSKYIGDFFNHFRKLTKMLKENRK